MRDTDWVNQYTYTANFSGTINRLFFKNKQLRKLLCEKKRPIKVKLQFPYYVLNEQVYQLYFNTP